MGSFQLPQRRYISNATGFFDLWGARTANYISQLPNLTLQSYGLHFVWGRKLDWKRLSPEPLLSTFPSICLDSVPQCVCTDGNIVVTATAGDMLTELSKCLGMLIWIRSNLISSQPSWRLWNTLQGPCTILYSRIFWLHVLGINFVVQYFELHFMDD